MKKEKLLEFASIITSGTLSNPVMSKLCSPIDSGPRQQLLHTIVKELTAVAFQMGITVEE